MNSIYMLHPLNSTIDKAKCRPDSIRSSQSQCMQTYIVYINSGVNKVSSIGKAVKRLNFQ